MAKVGAEVNRSAATVLRVLKNIILKHEQRAAYISYQLKKYLISISKI